MSSVKAETITPRKCGGRPTSDGWGLYNFIKIDGDRGKSFGKCGNCGNVLKNTSVQRMANHRRRCGVSGGVQAPTKEIQKFVQKIEDEPLEQREHEQDEMIWTSPGNIDEEFVEEPIAVEKVSRTAMEIINEDINRHRRSSKSKRQPTSQSIDAALSSFLIGCNLSFDIVDSVHFKNFANSLNHNYSIPSSNQLKAKVISQLQSMDSEERYKPLKKRRRYQSSDTDSD